MFQQRLKAKIQEIQKTHSYVKSSSCKTREVQDTIAKEELKKETHKTYF